MTQASSILVVDDDMELGRYAADVCRDAGHDALNVVTPFEALEVLARRPIQLVITDVRMPEMDGVELIARIKSTTPEVAIVAVTAFGSFEVAERAIRAGAYDYLAKPFKPEELLLRVGRALERREMALELARLRQMVSQQLGKK